MTTFHAGVGFPAPAGESIAPHFAPVPVRGRFLARVIALLAVALGLAHIWVLIAFPHGAAMSIVLLGMVAFCLKCAYSVWKQPRALLGLLVMSALMSIVHMFMALGFGGHVHGNSEPAGTATSAGIAMLAVAGAELVMVMFCSFGIRRASEDH